MYHETKKYHNQKVLQREELNEDSVKTEKGIALFLKSPSWIKISKKFRATSVWVAPSQIWRITHVLSIKFEVKSIWKLKNMSKHCSQKGKSKQMWRTKQKRKTKMCKIANLYTTQKRRFAIAPSSGKIWWCCINEKKMRHQKLVMSTTFQLRQFKNEEGKLDSDLCVSWLNLFEEVNVNSSVWMLEANSNAKSNDWSNVKYLPVCKGS